MLGGFLFSPQWVRPSAHCPGISSDSCASEQRAPLWCKGLAWEQFDGGRAKWSSAGECGCVKREETRRLLVVCCVDQSQKFHLPVTKMFLDMVSARVPLYKYSLSTNFHSPRPDMWWVELAYHSYTIRIPLQWCVYLSYCKLNHEQN